MVMAHPMPGQGWKVLWQDKEEILPVNGRVLGLVCEDHYGPALVVQNGQEIRLQGSGWSEQLDLHPGMRFRFHPNGLMAYLQEDGDLVVYGFADRSVRWSRWSHEG